MATYYQENVNHYFTPCDEANQFTECCLIDHRVRPIKGRTILKVRTWELRLRTQLGGMGYLSYSMLCFIFFIKAWQLFDFLSKKSYQMSYRSTLSQVIWNQ